MSIFFLLLLFANKSKTTIWKKWKQKHRFVYKLYGFFCCAYQNKQKKIVNSCRKSQAWWRRNTIKLHSKGFVIIFKLYHQFTAVVFIFTSPTSTGAQFIKFTSSKCSMIKVDLLHYGIAQTKYSLSVNRQYFSCLSACHLIFLLITYHQNRQLPY
jgi:hypothetical protein